MTRHFLDLADVESADLRAMIDAAKAFKGGREDRPMAGKTLAMIFDRPSTRTRVSFEVAVRQLGGHPVVLTSRDMQLGRGETIADTARVLSRYVDAIMIRAESHAKLTELAHHATVPVINGLTDRSHPCQIMADVMTIEEHRGPIRDKVVAWSGDANNVASSLVHAAVRFDFNLRIASPPELAPRADVMSWAAERQARLSVHEDPREAVRDADAVLTDVWVSMGDGDVERRHRLLEPYRIDSELRGVANPYEVFLL
jgi:ornithine carbamoyltransferase